MKQTAVEWLAKELMSQFGFAFSNNILEQAKEIEKQQIIDSLHYFGIERAEKYYNETFKNEK